MSGDRPVVVPAAAAVAEGRSGQVSAAVIGYSAEEAMA